MKKALLLLPLFAVACSSPRFVAKKTVEMEVPIAQASKLHCKTHNGNIKITRGDANDTIKLHAEMKVRGHSQEEADDNLHKLSVEHAIDGDTLRVFGKYPRTDLRRMSPGFHYTMQVPEHLALTLISHNGSIQSKGTKGALNVETHNGNVNSSVANHHADIETHNGGIELTIRSDQELDGSVVSHNGDIEVRVLDGAHGWLNASTHNGHITPPRTIHEADIKRHSLRCRIGEQDTEGKLVVTTHNGDITMRTADGSKGEFK